MRKRWTPRQAPAYDDEPLDFSTKDVVRFLRERRRPGFADLVQHIQTSLISERKCAEELREQLRALLPPPPPYYEPYNPRPPAEASD